MVCKSGLRPSVGAGLRTVEVKDSNLAYGDGAEGREQCERLCIHPSVVVLPIPIFGVVCGR
jgi:hypothetical protein